jgi:hypothetical protein
MTYALSKRLNIPIYPGLLGVRGRSDMDRRPGGISDTELRGRISSDMDLRVGNNSDMGKGHAGEAS